MGVSQPEISIFHTQLLLYYSIVLKVIVMPISLLLYDYMNTLAAMVF